MKKQEFLNELRRQLRGLPQDEIDNRVSFYEEMINDMIDEGKTEDQAIIEIGTVATRKHWRYTEYRIGKYN